MGDQRFPGPIELWADFSKPGRAAGSEVLDHQSLPELLITSSQFPGITETPVSAPNLMELTKVGIVSKLMSDENLAFTPHLNSRGGHSCDPVLQMRISVLRQVRSWVSFLLGGGVIGRRSRSIEQGSDRCEY